MKHIIENNEVRSPGWWLDEAMKLAVLRQDLQAELVKAEVKFRNDVLILAADYPYNKAENMAKGRAPRTEETMTPYEYYRYLVTRDKVVEEIIRIAKKRAAIPDSYI